MITVTKKTKIFLDTNGIDISPKIVNKRFVQQSSSQAFEEKKELDEILTIEVGCFLDQRKLLQENVEDIKIYLSEKSILDLKVRENLFKRVTSPTFGNNSFDTRKTKKQRPRIENKFDKNKRQLSEAEKISNTRSNINNLVFDVDNLYQGIAAKKFAGLSFLTKINVNQFLAGVKIKNIQNLNQTDEDLFGLRRKYEIRRVKGNKLRSKIGNSGYLRNISLETSEEKSEKEVPSVRMFRRDFYRNIKLGIDPIKFFEYSDIPVTIEEKARGSRKIVKRREEKTRKLFKKIATDRLLSTSNEELGFSIVNRGVSNRNRICKAQFEMTRAKIKKLSRNSGSINLIFYAFNKKGKRIDSFGVSFTADQLFKTEINPPLDFEVNASRRLRGSIITQIRNEELQPNYYNVYQKNFSKSQNFVRSKFSEAGQKIVVSSKNTKNLFDGFETNSKSSRFAKTRNVFQRINPLFEGFEIANTKSASVASQEHSENQMTCSVYAVQGEDDSIEVTITNISEDVAAILPVKRIAKGYRGNDYQTLKYLDENNLIEYNKVALDGNEENKSFEFVDNDAEDDVIYEYGCFLYNHSGHKQLAGSKFLEKRIDKEGLIQTEINFSENGETSFSPTSEETTRGIDFEIILNRQEDDVDKILNSIFGDNRSLFNDDLADIKDASNLLYGVRVHRIDALTGENVFVGSFRGYKQEDDQSTASSDIPKTYRATFTDFCPAFSSQIYKFDPYVIPPSQVLDKVFASLENLVKNNTGSRSTLNKLLVSKQRIINRDIVSSIETKFASMDSKKGIISSNQAFLQKNKNDLFVEGLTGDIVYENISPAFSLGSNTNLETIQSSVSKKNILDRNIRTKSFIPKNIVEVNFEIGPIDSLVDFYIIVKQINKDPNYIIDGAIHSKDLLDSQNNSQLNTSYTYLSSLKTSVGLVRYYLFGISKTGFILGPSFLGALTLEGE